MSVNYVEQGVCGNCGSDFLKLTRIDKDVNILAWYECLCCGYETIEVYEFTIKGVSKGDTD